MSTSQITAAPTQQQLVHAAHWYAAHGWHVFPLAPNSKRPAVDDWENAATTDRDAITRMWARAAFNIGIACGPSGLLVLDLDRPKPASETKDGTAIPAEAPPPPWDTEPGVTDGADVLVALAERAGQRFPDHTHTVATASGGLHLYFAQPGHDNPNHTNGEPVRLSNSAGRIGWKIDTRGHGGYVVAAGSVVDGQRYYTVRTARPAPLPTWITEALTRPKTPPPTTTPPGCPSRPGRDGEALRDGTAYAHAALRAELDRVLTAVEGTRNHTLNAAAYSLGQLCAAGLLDHGQVTTALMVAATHTGLPEAEAARTIASGLGSGSTQPRSLPIAHSQPSGRYRPRRTA